VARGILPLGSPGIGVRPRHTNTRITRARRRACDGQCHRALLLRVHGRYPDGHRCRSLTESIFRIGLFSNMHVYYGIVTALVLQFSFVYMPPLNALFRTHPLSAADWLAPTVVAVAGLPVVAMEKWFWRGGRAKSARTGALCTLTSFRSTSPRGRRASPHMAVQARVE